MLKRTPIGDWLFLPSLLLGALFITKGLDAACGFLLRGPVRMIILLSSQNNPTMPNCCWYLEDPWSVNMNQRKSTRANRANHLFSNSSYTNSLWILSACPTHPSNRTESIFDVASELVHLLGPKTLNSGVLLQWANIKSPIIVKRAALRKHYHEWCGWQGARF